MPPTKFWLNPTFHLGANVVWRFQDGSRGSHLGYQNRTILALLNLHVPVMPSIKFQPNQLTIWEEMSFWRISRWLPSWILEQNDFSNSASPCQSNATHQLSAQSDLFFRVENVKLVNTRCCTTDNRPQQKLTCSKTQGELKTRVRSLGVRMLTANMVV